MSMTDIFPTKIIKMIIDLHSKGYESLYLYSGLSPSGMNWRYEIGVIGDHGWPNRTYLASGSLDRENTDTNWSNGDLTVSELSDKFENQYRKSLGEARRSNPDFVKWFADLADNLDLTNSGLLIFYQDYDYSPHEFFLEKAPCYNGKY